jgi:alpha-L-fucosidase 2
MIKRILLSILLLLCSYARANDDLKLWYDHPASEKWESQEALPIGNGYMGAEVFGGITDERIQFNECTLWKGKPHDYVREGAGDVLDEIRRLVFDGKEKEVTLLIREKFLSDPVRQMPYQPFGDLVLHFPDHDGATDYRRELDLNTAIATVSYRVGDVTYRREVFASYPDHVIVVRISADRPGKLNFTVKMTSSQPSSHTKAISSDTLAMNGKVQDDGLAFESRLRVSGSGGKIDVGDQGINVAGANEVMLVLTAATSFVNFQDISGDPAARCEAVLRKVEGKEFDSLRANHVQDYSALFNRVHVDLGRTELADLPTGERLKRVNRAANPTASTKKDAPVPETLSSDGLPADPALAALYFQFGRYMLISCSRPGSQPANLQGVWNALLDPPWESKMTTNINLEMNYWPAEVTNLSECTAPLWNLIDDLTVSGARTAKKQYHARGWVLHHNTDLWRGTAPINNIDGVWPTGGAWLCYHLWEHYLFIEDKDFLRQRAYPAMRGASEFFVDSLVEDPKTNWLVTNPSFSPEQGGPCAGPAMDMQMIRALFDATIESSKILGIDADFAKQLTETRARLAPDQIGKHGQLQEWIEDKDVPNNNHRHMSPLWGLYPGAEFTPADPKLFNAAKVLLKWRGDGSTGWSYAWRMPLWARVYDGDFAYRQLALQLGKRTSPNLFDKCGPFQVDGDFGACAGVAEMLLQSQLRDSKTGVFQIDLLPALPSAWKTGSVSGVCARGGFVVDMTWKDGKLTATAIHSKLGNPAIVVYNGVQSDLKTAAGQTYTAEGTRPWEGFQR